MKKYTMEDYIKETPQVLQYNLDNHQQLVKPLIEKISNLKFKSIILIASGSSYNACYIAKPFLSKCLKCEIKIITPYTFTYYEHELINEALVLVISQSGQSTNAIEALKKIKELGYRAICLTGNKQNDVKNYAELVLDYGVGEELVGYVTKGVTTLAFYLCLFAINYSKQFEYLKELQKVVILNQEMIEKAELFIEAHYKSFSSMHQCYLCGAGGTFGVALEGALKVGETIHIPSNCFEVEEYIHGPNLQLDPSYTVIFFDGNDQASTRIQQIYQATRQISDHCYLICQRGGDDHILSLSDQVIFELSSLVYLPFIQLLSYLISRDLKTIYQHPLLNKFKQIASAKTASFVNYDDDN